HKTRIGMADANVVGEIGMLVRNVAPFEKGEVRFQKPILGTDVWECIADEAIRSGERVRVLDVEGSFLKVGRAET
ncbi:MAG: NfeD family protein, partial [Rhodocyclaceae bacterium]|nr:NfeD family protein [Rhodocyclaceae bacterium]